MSHRGLFDTNQRLSLSSYVSLCVKRTTYGTINTDGRPLPTKKLVEGKEMEAMGREEVGDRGKERIRDEGERWAVKMTWSTQLVGI